MRALALLQKSLQKALAPIHEYRQRTLWWATQALLLGGVLTLNELGRAVPGKSKKKHAIKRMSRFLGNKRLHSEQITIGRGIAHYKKSREFAAASEARVGRRGANVLGYEDVTAAAASG
jgi:hypothetical protein